MGLKFTESGCQDNEILKTISVIIVQGDIVHWEIHLALSTISIHVYTWCTMILTQMLRDVTLYLEDRMWWFNVEFSPNYHRYFPWRVVFPQCILLLSFPRHNNVLRLLKYSENINIFRPLDLLSIFKMLRPFSFVDDDDTPQVPLVIYLRNSVYSWVNYWIGSHVAFFTIFEFRIFFLLDWFPPKTRDPLNTTRHCFAGRENFTDSWISQGYSYES